MINPMNADTRIPCPHCKKMTKSGGRYCNHCGEPLETSNMNLGHQRYVTTTDASGSKTAATAPGAVAKTSEHRSTIVSDSPSADTTATGPGAKAVHDESININHGVTEPTIIKIILFMILLTTVILIGIAIILYINSNGIEGETSQINQIIPNELLNQSSNAAITSPIEMPGAIHAQSPTPTDTPIPTFSGTLTPSLTPSFTPTVAPSPIPIMIRQTCTHNLYKPIKECGYSHVREGDAAYVVKGKGIVCLRPEGDTTIYNCYGNAEEEDSMLITGGPRCDDNWLWWEAVTDQGIRGWLPEGDNLGDFFIESFCSEKVCKESRPSIFKVGDIAILTEWGSNQRIHDIPDVESPIGVVQKGQTVEILYGPACRNEMVWWKVRVIKTEEEGWIAEGNDKTYWLIPYTGVLEQ
jgi:hypothetical protein